MDGVPNARPRQISRLLWPLWLLPLLALAGILPLLFHGPSCGHDFGFHFQSWMDAADQIRHGDLLPRWAFSPAFNAGEPRFVFYPPLSWLLGSGLLLLLPARAVPAVFTWIVFAGAAIAMYSLARSFAGRRAALLAAAVYLANPYLLFTAFERTAFAELLAAVWMPLLFRATLAPSLSPLAVAVPLALLWLTNAPAAVMGTYAFALLVLVRAVLAWRSGRETHEGPSNPGLRLLSQAAGGLLLGLSLAGFYLLPAAWERRYVQIAMAIIPNMRVEDNFLFGHTGYGPHDQVLHTASVVALEVVGFTAAALLAACLRRRALRPDQPGFACQNRARTALASLGVLSLAVVLLLFRFTLPMWRHLPEMAFLQFPWRLLSVLGCALGLAVALALTRLRLPLLATAVTALLVVSGASFLAFQPFQQGCEASELPTARFARFRTRHGVGPTDEYTPTDADNDQLRWDDPAWWLATTPDAPGPGTVPNPAATIVDYDEPPLSQTVSGRAPMHLALHLAHPEDLVLNLRDYPAWRITVNGNPNLPHLQRDDGLLGLTLPAGNDTVDIRWQALPDVWAGDALSLVALGIAGWLGWRSRRIVSERCL